MWKVKEQFDDFPETKRRAHYLRHDADADLIRASSGSEFSWFQTQQTPLKCQIFKEQRLLFKLNCDFSCLKGHFHLKCLSGYQ